MRRTRSEGSIRRRLVAACLAAGLAAPSCGGSGSSPAPAPCDQVCMDQIAIQAFRETLRNIYNHYLQGMPVGPQDVSGPCPLGVGTVQVSGTATSNADQGTTEVDLTFVLTQCLFAEMATDPTHTYTMTLTGTATEKGTLAVQPSANTALTIQSDAMTFSGTVHDPPLNYQANACPLALVQDGNQLSGTVCGRQAGTSL